MSSHKEYAGGGDIPWEEIGLPRPVGMWCSTEDYATIRAFVIEQRRVPEHIPAAVREDREERERFVRLMASIGGEADGQAD